MSDALLRVENVRREFDGGRVQPLRGVNLTVCENDCLAILGPSGSGKTSLIHIMGGCDVPTRGRVLWRGKTVESQDDWRRLRATEIGIVFQEFLLLPALTAIENVEMALLANGLGAAARRKKKRRVARARRTEESAPPSSQRPVRRGTPARGDRAQHRQRAGAAAG